VRVVPALPAPAVGVDRDSAIPLYRQLYEAYRNAIVERRFRGGQRVPSTRSLAAELGISRIAVLGAFEQLLAEGYFESRPGSGTFVAAALPDEILRPRPAAAGAPSRPGTGKRPIARRTDGIRRKTPRPWWMGGGAFSVGEPPVDQFPFRTWSSLLGRRARRADARELCIGNALGLPALREAVAEYLRAARAVRCEADHVMITGGSQQALDLAARVLLDPGDPAWIEEPSYFGIRKVLSLAGVRPVPVRVDAEGIDVDAGIAREPRARAAFVTPSHQFPLGVTMSATRRLQLLDWARRTGSWIVEDDYDSEYRYGNLPIASLQGLDRDARVVYVGTFTKILFPGLRLGYLVLPPDLVDAFVDARGATDFYSPTFLQAVLADFIREGHFARHIRRIRLVCGQRRAALVEAIERNLGDTLTVLGDDAGMYLTAALPAGTNDRDVAARAAERGVWTPPLSDAYLGESRRRPGLILGYGGTDLPAIAEGIARLRGIVERSGAPASPRRPVRRGGLA
jgi:GntR family transcriptional regulator/MocR family aminotransferase